MTGELSHLRSTIDLIRKAFPDGISDEDYAFVLRLFYDHLSDRNLADVISLTTGREPATTLNDIYRSASIPESDRDLERVRSVLYEHGFEAWLDED